MELTCYRTCKFYSMCMLSCFSRVQLCAALWTVVRQVPLSMGYPRQEYLRSGLPFPPPGDLADSGIESMSLPLFYDNHVLFVWKKTKLEKYSIWAPSLPEAACTHAKSTRGGQISRFFALFMTSVAVTVLLRFFLHEIILSRK